MKRLYEVTYIDNNGCAVNEIYTATDLIALFMILAKESINRETKYGLKKLIIEEMK